MVSHKKTLLERIKLFHRILKKIRFGRKDIYLDEVIVELSRQLKKDDIGARANAVAFNFTMAIFPGIIFLFTMIPYIPIPNLTENIMGFLKGAMPPSLYIEAASTIFDIVGKQHGGLLSFGFLFALYASTNGMSAIISTFNSCYRTQDDRSFFHQKLLAVGLTLVLVFTLFVAVAGIITGGVILDSMVSFGILKKDYIYNLLSISQYLVVILTFFLGISFIYYLAPNVTVRWNFFSHGSVIATILTVLVSYGFSIYLSNFASYNKLYGSIGTFIGLMLWLYIMSYIILVGFEINAAIDATKRKHDRHKPYVEKS